MRLRALLVTAALLAAPATRGVAQQVSTRADLNALLPSSTTETFEGFGALAGGQATISATTVNSASDSRLMPGITYTSANGMFWAPGAGYFGYSSDAFEGDGIFGINFNAPTTAFGFDFADYSGFGGNTTINIFNGATVLSSQTVFAADAPGSTFYGWQNGAGITRVEILSDHDNFWTPSVDNVQYGVAVTTPEPASLVLLATGLVGTAGLARNRKRNR